jgi:hypothetical protein
MATNFEEFVANERERLTKARDDANAKKKAAEVELLVIEVEFAAIAAYEQVKRGKPLQIERARAPRAPGAQRGRRGEKRTEILNLIKGSPEGYTRGEVIEKLNATDKSAQQSISNALSALFKATELKKDGKKYLTA